MVSNHSSLVRNTWISILLHDTTFHSTVSVNRNWKISIIDIWPLFIFKKHHTLFIVSNRLLVFTASRSVLCWAGPFTEKPLTTRRPNWDSALMIRGAVLLPRPHGCCEKDRTSSWSLPILILTASQPCPVVRSTCDTRHRLSKFAFPMVIIPPMLPIITSIQTGVSANPRLESRPLVVSWWTLERRICSKLFMEWMSYLAWRVFIGRKLKYRSNVTTQWR